MSKKEEFLEWSELPTMPALATSVQQDTVRNSHGIAYSCETMFRTFEIYIRRELPKNIKPTKNSIKMLCSKEIEKFINSSVINGGSNILHWIASRVAAFDNDNLRGESAMILAELIAEMVSAVYPEMLQSLDITNQLTPIQAFLNIREAPVSTGKIILAMCREAVNSSGQGLAIVAKAISMANTVGENCLHMAAQSRSSSGIFQLLVRLAPPEAVVVSSGGKTPLHVLLEHGLCSFSDPNTGDAQNEAETFRQYFKNLAVLITKNPDVLEIPNNAGESPYMVFKRKESALEDVVRGHQLSWWRRTEELLTESAFGLRGFENALKCFYGNCHGPCK